MSRFGSGQWRLAAPQEKRLYGHPGAVRCTLAIIRCSSFRFFRLGELLEPIVGFKR